VLSFRAGHQIASFALKLDYLINTDRFESLPLSKEQNSIETWSQCESGLAALKKTSHPGDKKAESRIISFKSASQTLFGNAFLI
jgi:hypothetical protein